MGKQAKNTKENKEVIQTIVYKPELSPIYVKHGIWESWHKKTFDDYIGNDFQVNEVFDLIDSESNDNVILYGNNGTGKTMLMNLAMKELLHRGKAVYVIDFRNLIKVYTASWKGNTNALNHILSVDYLAVDDLGKEFKNEGVSKELANSTLDYVLRYRVQREKPTWLTFNMLLKDVKSVYNEHIASLLKRNTTAILFDGDDYGDNLIKIRKQR